MEGLGNIPIPANYNGNIDLNNRQVYQHPDGYIQTEHSIGAAFDPGDQYSLSLPTIVNGQPVTDEAARQNFFNTGEHLGVTHRGLEETPEAFYARVNAEAQALHERQAEYYLRGPGAQPIKEVKNGL